MPATPSFHHLSVIAVLTTSLGLLGCSSMPSTAHIPAPPSLESWSSTSTHQARPATPLSWAGTYQAILPCHDCPGLAISVQLRSDLRAVVRERRLGSDMTAAQMQTYAGPIEFKGNLLTLRTAPDAPVAYQFWAGGRWLELRDRSAGTGTTAAFPPRSHHRLHQTSTHD